jgi:hypothetical protein
MSTPILTAAEHLADILAQENEALNRLDFASAVALLGAKDAALADLAQQPKVPAPPTLPAVLRRISGLAAENQQLLERALAVQTRVVRLVARACAPPPVITQYGGYGGQKASNGAVALAVSTRA